MRSRVIMVLAIVTIVLGGALIVPAAWARLSGGQNPLAGAPLLGGSAGGDPAPAPTAPPPPTLAAGPVSLKVSPFASWALLDRTTGKISGSTNITATNSTESMIKVWLVSDYLRRLGDKQPPAAMLDKATTAILDSNDESAESLYNAGGRTPVISRLISICGLTDTRISTTPGYVGWWSFTQISARDAVRMGACVKDGRAAGKWTNWVLTEMAKVRGSVTNQHPTYGGGRWGIIDGLPKEILTQGPVSIKNGWTLINADGLWHVNCLAITDKWVLAVLMRYSGNNSLVPSYGASVCASVASQLVTPEPGAAIKVPQPLAKG